MAFSLRSRCRNGPARNTSLEEKANIDYRYFYGDIKSFTGSRNFLCKAITLTLCFPWKRQGFGLEGGWPRRRLGVGGLPSTRAPQAASLRSPREPGGRRGKDFQLSGEQIPALTTSPCTSGEADGG